MQWSDGNGRHTVIYSLRDLRTAKGITQRQLAEVCNISKSLYAAIESGHRRPSIDVLYVLAMIYRTSMDFIYHAFHRQHIVWHFPDGDLNYALRDAMQLDIQYLADRKPPIAPPTLPDSVVWERAAPCPGFIPYGLHKVAAQGLME